MGFFREGRETGCWLQHWGDLVGQKLWVLMLWFWGFCFGFWLCVCICGGSLWVSRRSLAVFSPLGRLRTLTWECRGPERPQEKGGCQFGLVGRGGPPPESCGYRKGELVLSQQALGAPSPSPMCTSCLLSFYTVVGSTGSPSPGAGNQGAGLVLMLTTPCLTCLRGALLAGGGIGCFLPTLRGSPFTVPQDGQPLALLGS